MVFINNFIKNIFDTENPFKSFCEGKIITHLVAFFIHTIFLNAVLDSLEYLVCSIGHENGLVLSISCTLIIYVAPTCQFHATPCFMAV